MAPAATVLIPTHNHGRLLALATESALAQTVEDLEVFIIGDGPTEETHETARRLEAGDGRVRYFANAKGRRHGELHRHAALLEATAPIVCYLSDDDLWLPDHVAYLLELLSDHDFAHTLPVYARADGSVRVHPGNLADRKWWDFILTEGNFIPLPAAGHTMELYRRLPHGWRPAPDDAWSDQHMWRQILSVPDVDAVSGSRPTMVHLASPFRGGAGIEDRYAELAAWSRRLADPGGRRDFRDEVFAALAEQLAGEARRAMVLDRKLARQEERDAAQIARLQARLDETERSRDVARRRLQSARGSLTWRARERLLTLPLIGRAGRWVGRALARRRGP